MAALQVKHYMMLAESSHRAGNITVEASAYFGMAVLLDNQQRYLEVSCKTEIGGAGAELARWNTECVVCVLLARRLSIMRSTQHSLIRFRTLHN